MRGWKFGGPVLVLGLDAAAHHGYRSITGRCEAGELDAGGGGRDARVRGHDAGERIRRPRVRWRAASFVFAEARAADLQVPEAVANGLIAQAGERGGGVSAREQHRGACPAR